MQCSRSNTYASVLLICALFSPVLPAQATVPDETTTITLDQAVHFIGTDGSDAVAAPGDYSVEAAQEWLRLIPGTERRDALLIEAQPGTHEVKVEIPIVISTQGTEPDELDIHIVQLLNPDGTSLIATGTYSGIQPRGLRDRARQAAARARARAEGARRAAAAKAQQTADTARIAALKAKKAAEEAAAKAGQFAKIAICKATGSALKAGKAATDFTQKIVSTAKQKLASGKNRFKNDTNFRDRIQTMITNQIRAHQSKIPELNRIMMGMNNPKNRAKVDAIFGDGFCEDSNTERDKKLNQFGFAPNFAQVQSRGTPTGPRGIVAYRKTVGGAVVMGGQTGQIIVSDLTGLPGHGGSYWFIGPMVETNIAASAVFEIAVFPNATFDSFAGWSDGISASLGYIAVGGVALWMESNGDYDRIKGFGPMLGIGIGVLPGEAAFSSTYSWVPWERPF